MECARASDGLSGKLLMESGSERRSARFYFHAIAFSSSSPQMPPLVKDCDLILLYCYNGLSELEKESMISKSKADQLPSLYKTHLAHLKELSTHTRVILLLIVILISSVWFYTNWSIIYLEARANPLEILHVPSTYRSVEKQFARLTHLVDSNLC